MSRTLPEQSPQAESLVEQDIARIEAKIEASFASPDSELTRTLHDSAVLLEARGIDLGYAIKDSGLLTDTPIQTINNVINRPTSATYRLDKQQIIELNRHPYVRTVAVTELVTYLDASGTLIRGVVRDLGVAPAMPAGVQVSPQYSRNTERFNKDQITVIDREIRRRTTPPENTTSLSKLRLANKMSGVALEEAVEALALKPEWFRDPVSSEGDRYVTREEAAMIIEHAGGPALRQKRQT